MIFIAEIVEIKERKTVDLEKEYTIKLRTSDRMVMELSQIPVDSNIKITIEHDR